MKYMLLINAGATDENGESAGGGSVEDWMAERAFLRRRLDSVSGSADGAR